MLKSILAGLLVWLLTAQFAQANKFQVRSELQERYDIERMVVTTFTAGEFGILEGIGEEYRTRQSRTSSGVWKLSIFYNAFGGQQMAEFAGGIESGRIEAQAKAWLTAFPNSPTANIAYTQILRQIAWAKRGNGYYHELNEAQKQGFRAAMAEVTQQLEASKKYASADPHWYTLALLTGRDESWPQGKYAKLVEEAVKSEPYYYETYFMMIEDALPQWGGSAEAIDAVVKFGTEQTKQRDGQSFRARAYWFLSDRQYGRELYNESSADWKELKPAFDDLLAKYPSEWNSNAYARLACLAGDVETGTKLLDSLHGRVVVRGWQYLEMLQPCGYSPGTMKVPAQ